MSVDNSQPPLPRRSFFGLLGTIFTGVIGLVMGVSSSIYLLFPAFSSKRSRDLVWQTIGQLKEIPEGYTKFTLEIATPAGWAESTTKQAIWVGRKGEQIDIFSAVCPHEGCTVTWETEKFICLCHVSQWQNDGHKVSGPSPRNLDKLEYQINNGQLQVKYQNFRRGISEKIPLA